MIKILYDHQIFSEQRYGGISRYFANLCKGINKGKMGSVKIGVLYAKNYYVSFYFQPFNNPLGRWLLRKAHKRYQWNKKYSIKLLKAGKHEIFHGTYYDTYSLAYNKKPMVITIHDMIYENNPQMFPDSAEVIARKEKLMDSAASIIAISNFTRAEIIKFYPHHAQKITVVHHGIDMSHSPQKEKIDLPFKFILFVGERGIYKNFITFVTAISQLLTCDSELKLICAGGKEFNDNEKKSLEQHKITTQCIQMEVTDAILQKLYEKALVFVFPSTQEGFGLPLLEAFKYNCPIAGSNTSCFPEIGGDAIAYFDPNDAESVFLTVKKVIEDSSYAKELKNKGKERLKYFTMENCISNTLEVYKSLLR